MGLLVTSVSSELVWSTHEERPLVAQSSAGCVARGIGMQIPDVVSVFPFPANYTFSAFWL